MCTSLIPTAGLLVFVTAIASVLLPISSDATHVHVSFREKRGTRRPDASPPDTHAGEAGVEVSEYSVRCLVESRYARTWARLEVVNAGAARRLVPLQLPVPASAFVSNFSVVVGNKTYVSRVRERAQQKAAVHKHSYNDTGPRGWHVLRASVPVPAGARAVLAITHEALLQRRLGRYEVALSMRPGVAARSLRLHVELAESAGISELTVLPLRPAAGQTTAARRHDTGQAPEGTAVERSATRARVRYEPTVQQRSGLSAAERLGEFVVWYDVSRHLGVGDIQVRDGYFVHYFAPTDLPAVPKDVVFVIDTSGSMIGTKIGQTKDAMQTILKELRTGDRFNVVTFSERVRVWRPGRMVEVTRDAVRDARKYIYLASPAGGTNINAALLTGARLLARPAAPADDRVSLLVFLTDGQPTAGDTDRVAIVTQARAAAAQGRFCIFSLGFGADADFALLDALAAGSCGVARRVYDGADASAQLKGFYDEIGTPVLTDVRVAYPDGGVRDLTQSVFANYFNGSELVVAGRLAGNRSGGGAAPFSGDALRVQVSARAAGNRLRVEGDVALQKPSAPGGTGTGHGNGTEEEEAREPLTPRLWAFLTIKELLKTRLRDPLRGNGSTAGTGGAAAPPRSPLDATQRAMDLSLQHHFLTPVTSLVMEEEDEGQEEEQEEADEGEEEEADEAGAGEERTRDGNGQNKVEEEDEEEAEEEGPEDVGGLDGTQFALPAAYLATEEEEAAAAAESGARAGAKPAKLSADGDPHFVVELPRSGLTVCFNIDGEPGHVLRLVDDHGHSGVTVNGQLVGSPAPPGSRKRRRTYFGTVALVSEHPRRAYVLVTPTRVVLDGAERLVLPCDRSASARRDGLAVAVAAGTSVTVTLLGNITFVIQLHLYKRPESFQRDHLGVYILSGGSLSPHTHGLLGQFLHARATVVVAETPAPAAATVVAGATTTVAGTGNRDETEEEGETEEEDREERAGATATAPGLSATATPAVPADGAASPATLNIGGRRLPVTARVRRTHGSGGPHDVACWFARSNARGLVQGCYADYVACDLYDFRSGGGGDCGESYGEDYNEDDGNFA
ncbi:inter-alpha-trypsin inhibitor heavy chain H5 [Lethenteron reissneri]|uniref:inter-alpha-trypsin inhibitor heavy chain H5 n=1 Tax=Lethenteron reissneri TaxID=7753 RepID=UPI002AB727C7|nr:inter-alpha-trypsin inhibitor heavy chain H5 [Lethenteron reissneri]